MNFSADMVAKMKLKITFDKTPTWTVLWLVSNIIDKEVSFGVWYPPSTEVRNVYNSIVLNADLTMAHKVTGTITLNVEPAIWARETAYLLEGVPDHVLTLSPMLGITIEKET